MRKHSTATPEDIANWTLPSPTKADVKRAEKLGRELFPLEHDPKGKKRKVVRTIRRLQDGYANP
ncbi:MAG: hypothetical protein KIT08_01440 [Anaerolineales bacterium]|nr:MAG: hypothetical protein KIT08_01440 [Anaerolineales bacterium]